MAVGVTNANGFLSHVLRNFIEELQRLESAQQEMRFLSHVLRNFIEELISPPMQK